MKAIIRPGNLMSYKMHIRPAARRLYGGSRRGATVHQRYIHDLLMIMFRGGALTTWEAASIGKRDIASIREADRAYRRLLEGRTDRGRSSDGLADSGLVTVDENGSRGRYRRYRLSLHGILYCLDALDPAPADTDRMASSYAGVLPRVFGRWAKLQGLPGGGVGPLRVLARGILLSGPQAAAGADGPLHELMSFLHYRYHGSFDYMSEDDLVVQASLWFYTSLLHPAIGSGMLEGMLSADPDLLAWYGLFADGARAHYGAMQGALDGFSPGRITGRFSR